MEKRDASLTAYIIHDLIGLSIADDNGVSIVYAVQYMYLLGLAITANMTGQ